MNPELRRKLLNQLLQTPLTNESPISFLTTYFSLIKFLGRSPAGSEELGRETVLRLLLDFGGLERAAGFPDRIEREDDYLLEEVATEEDPLDDYESESLRCLCNTLTLHPASREIFPAILLEKRAWLDGLVRLVDVQGAGFLAGRLLFLLTSKPGAVVVELVESTNVIPAMANVSSSFSHSTTLTNPLQ